MDDFLTIYIRDHHAAAAAGMALARRAADAVGPGGELGSVASEIEDDFESLERVMVALGVERSPLKDTLARTGERIGRLKGNGRLVERSPLSDVVELELLGSGIAAKVALWRSLSLTRREVAGGPELDRLIERGLRQQEVVERWRVAAVQTAFGVSADEQRAAGAARSA